MRDANGRDDNPALTAYWLDHYADTETVLCTLCANTGRIDTTQSAISAIGVRPGRVNWCLCPNGRTLRRMHDGPTMTRKE
jgi:hypothetical protein